MRFFGRRARAVTLLVLSSLATSACSAPGVYNWKGESTTGYKVGINDVLKVSVWKKEEVSVPTVSVRPDGAISLPLIGDIAAKGHTTNEIAKDISDKLKPYYNEPTISVSVQVLEVKSYKVYVVGEVNRAGEYASNGEMSALQVLALAGGFTRFADPVHMVIIRRDARGERRIPINYDAVIEKGDLQQNLTLQTGDTLVVP